VKNKTAKDRERDYTYNTLLRHTCMKKKKQQQQQTTITQCPTQKEREREMLPL
jgi:hypothetical protein